MKIKTFNDWSIFAKIISISIFAIIPITLVLLLFILPEIKNLLIEEKKLQTRNAVEIAYSLTVEYQERVDKGEFDLREAQARAAKRISKLRYNNGKEYFWINDLTPTIIMHPLRPEMVGKDAANIKDAEGNKIYVEFVDICQKDTGGFLLYNQLKPGVDKPLPKISFVKVFNKWGWIIGTGLYLESIENEMALIKRNIYIISVFSFLFALVFGYLISKKLSKPIKNLNEAAGKIAMGDANVKVEYISQDEIGSLSASFNLMVQNIKYQAEIARNIASGNLDIDIKEKSKDDILTLSLAHVVKTLHSLVDEVSLLTEESKAGNLSLRGNAEKFDGGYKRIITGVNNTLEAVISPLYTAADYVQRISCGDIPDEIKEDYKGDFKEIKQSLNTCIAAIKSLIHDTTYLSNAAIEGKLSERADITKHQGEFKRIVVGVNNTMDAVINPLTVAASYVNRISKGDIPAKISTKYNGDFEILIANINTLIEAVNNLISDSEFLSASATRGNINSRADSEKHSGKFKELIMGVNKTFDSLVGFIDIMPMPSMIIDNNMNILYMNESGAKLNNKTGKELMNTKCYDFFKTDDCKTEQCACHKTLTTGNNSNHETQARPSNHKLDIYYSAIPLKDNQGNIIGAFEVITDQTDIKKAIRKADKVNQYQQNETTKLISGLTRFSKGDLNFELLTEVNDEDTKEAKDLFDNINIAIKNTVMAVKGLVNDINSLSDSAIAGELSKRSDSQKHGGEFKKIVEGVNSTLDAVLTPLNFAASYIQKMADGKELEIIDLDKFRGDFRLLMGNLDLVRQSLSTLSAESLKLSQAAIKGDLSVRGELSKIEGTYKKIIDGFNQTLDTMLMPINEGVKAMEKMAMGDLTIRIKSDYKGDHQLIKNSLNTVAESLSKALNDVREAVDATASASNQISSSTEEMAAGASEQTTQAAEVAGAVEEMTKTILENTRNASKAADNAHDAGRKAKEGGEVVKETIDGMNKIASVVKKSTEKVQALGQSSDQIGEIAQVIDDIADQTNLLALNAAIEAARAGEQGRGFAVVADEVRKLAERTTKATKEIAIMIKQIQKDTSEAVIAMEEGTHEVNNGIKLANQAGVSLQDIISSSDIVVDIVNMVATASEEQSTAANEISNSIEAISNVTRETATGTGQIARAAEDLSRLTLNLEQLIDQFKISEHFQTKHKLDTKHDNKQLMN